MSISILNLKLRVNQRGAEVIGGLASMASTPPVTSISPKANQGPSATANGEV